MTVLFKNGNIHTMDAAVPQADAVVVNKNKREGLKQRIEGDTTWLEGGRLESRFF